MDECVIPRPQPTSDQSSSLSTNACYLNMFHMVEYTCISALNGRSIAGFNLALNKPPTSVRIEPAPAEVRPSTLPHRDQPRMYGVFDTHTPPSAFRTRCLSTSNSVTSFPIIFISLIHLPLNFKLEGFILKLKIF